MKLKQTVNTIKNFFKKIDSFGVSFSFKYKAEDNYSTVLGGIISLFFFIIFFLYLLYNFIPFYKKENFTLQYYTMNLEETENIELKDSPTTFAVGLDCPYDETNNISAKELFDLKLNFTTKKKLENGTTVNKTVNETVNEIDIETDIIPMNLCQKEDFYNLHDTKFDYLKIQNLYCLKRTDEKKHNLKGIYTE